MYARALLPEQSRDHTLLITICEKTIGWIVGKLTIYIKIVSIYSIKLLRRHLKTLPTSYMHFIIFGNVMEYHNEALWSPLINFGYLRDPINYGLG